MTWGTLVRRVLPLVAASAVVGNGVRLRRRLTALSVIDPRSVVGASTPPPGSTTTSATDDAAPAVVVMTVEGGGLDDAVVAAAAAHLGARGLDAVDLVPADLPADQLLDVLRICDVRTLRGKTVPMGRGAGQAVVVRRGLAERAGLVGGPHDPVELRRAFLQAKRYSPHGCDQALVPSLRAAPVRADQLLSVWRSEYGRLMAALLPTRFGPAAVAGAAAAAGATGAALVVGAAVAAQPAVVTAATPARPRDLASPATAIRLLAGPARIAAALRGGWRPERPAHTDLRFIAEHRRGYESDLAAGVERFLGAELDACPVCAGTAIRPRISSPDLVQCKPGTFRVDVCDACGTSFQNPPLTAQGLDFYYRDFYDGAGEFDTEMMFSADDWLYEKRAGMVGEYTEPKRWLDVGGGHGHFCLVASTLYPDTRFELVDQETPVAEAVRRGWVADGHGGSFPDVAPVLDGTFDVVTMFHYLEHTADPLAELDAAHRVLEPGGTLVIEVPAPDSRMADLLGWAWGPWMQPQHLHLLPLDTMVDQLERRGFEVLDTNRGRFYTAWDLSWAAFQVLTRLAPGPDAPWTPARSRAHRAGRLAAFVASGPALALALLLDKAVVTPLAKLDGRVSSVFTVVARKVDATAAGAG